MKACCYDDIAKDCRHQIQLNVFSPNFLSPLQQHGGGNGSLRYCGIELVFKRYFGNLDFEVGYCGII